MSIASRITSMENNIRNAYHGLDSIGIDTTNTNKNIENISALLDDFYDSLPKVSESGSNISLSPTRKGRITSQINGDTFQQTYNGINILPNNITNQTLNGITFTKNKDGSLILNGTSTSAFNMYLLENGNYTLNAGIYTMYCEGRKSGKIGIYFNSASSTRISQIGATESDSVISKQFTINEDTTLFSSWLYITNGTTFNNVIIKPMLVKGTSITGYEPYVGGTASPNPEFPQNIESVTGLQKISNVGKNLFDIEDGTYKSNDEEASITFANGVMTNFTHNKTSSFGIKIPLRTPIILKTNQSYTRGNNSGMAYPYITLYDVNSQSINTMAGSDNGVKTYTPTEQKEVHYIYLWFAYNLTYTELKPMMNIGSALETFEKYDGETYDINLGNIELNKKDTLQDYITGTPNNWSILNQIGKVVLDGNSNINASSSNENYSVFYINVSDISIGTTSLLSNYFTRGNRNNVLNGLVEGIATHNSRTRIYFSIRTSIASTVETFKTWLSTHNTKVIYELATPTTTPITDTTLINDLNNFYYAKSKQGQTNISVDGNLPMILDVSALKGEE